MKYKSLKTLAISLPLLLSGQIVNADIVLAESGFRLDGASVAPTSSTIDGTGLGTAIFTVTGAGSHSFDAFFDHEIDTTLNTYFNESGSQHGSLATGQSWEIDEPGYVFGDIFDNFEDSLLDNTNAVPVTIEDDVSMAIGWDFTLAVGQTAEITMLLSLTEPESFYLRHFDAASNIAIYFSSALDIQTDNSGGNNVPEPSILLLLSSGLLALRGLRKQQNS